MASRCEAQMRFDWDFNPGLYSLAFASKVNLAVTLSINRAIRRGAAAGALPADTGKATTRLYELLWNGEYMQNGRRLPVKGDVVLYHL